MKHIIAFILFFAVTCQAADVRIDIRVIKKHEYIIAGDGNYGYGVSIIHSASCTNAAHKSAIITNSNATGDIMWGGSRQKLRSPTIQNTLGGFSNFAKIPGGYSSEMGENGNVELDTSYPIIGGGYFSNINDPDHYECFTKGGATNKCRYGPGTCLDNHGCTHDRAYIYGGHPGCIGADCRWCVYWHVSSCKGVMEHNNETNSHAVIRGEYGGVCKTTHDRKCPMYGTTNDHNYEGYGFVGDGRIEAPDLTQYGVVLGGTNNYSLVCGKTDGVEIHDKRCPLYGTTKQHRE